MQPQGLWSRSGVDEQVACRVHSQMSKTWESATKPGAAQKVIALQLDAFWQAHGNKVIALVAFLSIYLMW